MESNSAPKKIKCPYCKQPTVYSPDNPYRPFCCERCQMIDLGEWADERKSIPGPAASPEDMTQAALDEIVRDDDQEDSTGRASAEDLH